MRKSQFVGFSPFFKRELPPVGVNDGIGSRKETALVLHGITVTEFRHFMKLFERPYVVAPQVLCVIL